MWTLGIMEVGNLRQTGATGKDKYLQAIPRIQPSVSAWTRSAELNFG